MKEKVFLAGFGILLGTLLTLCARPFLIKKAPSAEGSEFASIEDLRRSMLQRDERDVIDGGSVSLRSILVPHPSDQIMYHLRPNLEVKFQGQPLRTNSCGMRYREVSVPKGSNVFRIALMGDSFAFGWGVKAEESFASRLESILNFYTEGTPRIEVLNFGVPGYSTFQQAALFEETAADFLPDLVLFYFVSNDFYPPFFIRDLNRSDQLVDSGTYAKRFGERGSLPVGDARESLHDFLDPNIALSSVLDNHKGRFFTYLAINPNREAKSSQARLWILRKRKGELHQIKMRHALLDIVERNEIDIRDLSLPDDPHPSPKSHNILAGILAQNIVEVLAPWARNETENLGQGDSTTDL